MRGAWRFFRHAWHGQIRTEDMTLDDELRDIGGAVQASFEHAAQHFERVAGVARLDKTILNHYREYLDTTKLVLQTTLDHCGRLASTCAGSGAFSNEDAKGSVRGLIGGVVESMKAMYLAMAVVEHLIQRADEHHPVPQARQEGSRAERRCSYCGKEADVVAGPGVGICADCTRLACAVFGVALKE